MERSDFGTNETGTSGGVDDVSFGKTAGSGSTPSTSDTEVSAIGSSSDTASTDASGSADLSTGAVAEGRLAAAKQKLGVAKEKVVDRVHATADWIKEKDIDQIKTGIEAQVRDHPGRTLLIAVGLGYLIGRAFRGSNSA